MRYITDPEDKLEISPNGILIDSGKRMIFFELDAVKSAGFIKNLKADKASFPAFCFTAEDALLGREYDVLIPENDENYVNFIEKFRQFLPNLEFLPPREDLPPQCDQHGHHSS